LSNFGISKSLGSPGGSIDKQDVINLWLYAVDMHWVYSLAEDEISKTV